MKVYSAGAGSELLQPLVIDPVNVFITIFMILGLPLISGILVNTKFPKFTSKIVIGFKVQASIAEVVHDPPVKEIRRPGAVQYRRFVIKPLVFPALNPGLHFTPDQACEMHANSFNEDQESSLLFAD